MVKVASTSLRARETTKDSSMSGGTPDAFMIGDGKFFWNLRPIRHYSERVCFGSSLLANMILTALLLLEKNRLIKPYSRVLLLNAIFDYVYTFVSFPVEMVSKSAGQFP